MARERDVEEGDKNEEEDIRRRNKGPQGSTIEQVLD
jgi:hypothetical protein